MPFEVFPQPQTSPIKLEQGKTTEDTGDDITIPNLAWDNWAIHICVSSSSEKVPSVRIQVLNQNDEPQGWMPVTAITPIAEEFFYVDAFTGASLTAGWVSVSATTSDMVDYTNADQVLKVLINIQSTEVKWQLRIENNSDSEDAQDFVCVVGTNDGESRQPWINVTPSALTYDVLINEIPENTKLPLTVENKGTGPLTITGTTSQLPPDFTFPVPSPIDPNSSTDIEITFNAPAAPPAPDGKTIEDSTEFSLVKPDTTASNASEHNKFFKLTATTRALEVMLLLDASGSMGWAPDGSHLPPDSLGSRWSELVSAVKLFLDLLAAFGHEHGKFGIARFPADSSVSPPIFDVVPPTDIPVISLPVQPDMDQHKTTLDGVTPENNTPMGDGLAHVLPPDPSYFSDYPIDKTVNRRWVLLFSDGADNYSTVAPVSFIQSTPNTFEDNKIKLFAVGYGTENAPSHSVDWELLDDLADASFESDGTNKCRVDVENESAGNLASAFKKAILASLSPKLTSPSDPSGILYSDMPEARHQVIITQHDTKAAFTLHWNKPDTERMKLQLLTPMCELITPESAGGDSGKSGITFSKDLRYQMYSVNHDYLRNAKDPSRPRYGTWTLIGSSDKLDRGDSESYTHDVIVESRLRMDVRTDRRIHYAGDPIGLSAVLTLNGRPVKNAAVTVRETIPGHFVGNWLAAATVSDKEYQEASKTLAGQDVTPLFIKSYAALKKGITFEPFTTSETIPMNDSSGNGIYEASVNRTSVPGGYTFYITAIGQTEDGVMFRREREVQIGVSVRPEPEYTLFDVQYHRIPDSGPGVIGTDITVWPRDRFGNVVLVDPAYNPCIEIMARGKKPEGKLVGNMDGSYSQTVRFAAGKIPGIGLKVSGREVVRELHLPPVDRLHYVDRVIDFRKGSEAEKGANKHSNPQAVLGDVTEKDRERFVSLGGFGSITVGFDREGILASRKAEDDVTVFVRRDEDLRPYVVEAQRSPARDKWVELGVSPGVTQSFSLGKAGLRKATAIRITDRSRRTTDSEGKPIATPGVSIRGVGVRRVE